MASGFPSRVFFLLVLACTMMLASSLSAGVDVWTDTPVSSGVVWRSKTYTSLYGGKQSVNVLEIDLSSPAVKIQPIFAAPAGSCEVPSAMGARTGAKAVINAGFFGGCDSVSMIKIADSYIASNPGNKPARATFGINQSTSVPYIDWVAANDSWSAVDDAVGGGPNLVSAGVSDVTLTDEGFDSSYAAKNPRTAVGYTTSNKVLFVTVDGRTSAGVGMTLSELSSYMINLGCYEAMNLDGGGSTDMWVSGVGVVNTPSDGSQRPVVSGLGVWEQSVIVDNVGAGYAEVGTWASSANAGYYGSDSRYNSTGTGADTATWTPTIPKNGKYNVYAWWVAGSNRPTNAVYQIQHQLGTSNIAANQSTNGSQWNLLGSFNLNAGTAGKVILTDNGTAGKVVSADAVKLLYVGPQDPVSVIADNVGGAFTASANWVASTSNTGYYGANYHVRATASVSDPAAWTVNLPQAGSYKVYARWTSGTNRATVAPYQIVHSGGTTTVNVNQQTNNGTWVLLGTFNFTAGSAERVRLSCWTTLGYYVVADAVKFDLQ